MIKPLLDGIRKQASQDAQSVFDTLAARNQSRAAALNLPVNDISAIGKALMGGVLDVDYDPSTNDIISKQIKAPRATGGLANRIAREHSLSHELSEAEYVKRRNLLPLHSHADLGVLIDEARERALLPSDIQRKERDERTSDLEFWESSPGGSMNDFARKILEAESNKRITRNALIKQYLEEKKYNNSLLYPGNFIDNVTANIRAAKGKPYTKDDLEAMAWNRMLDARIQYNHDKERAAALEIGAKGDKAGIIGGVLGGLGLGAGAFASFKNPKIGIPAGIAGLAAGGLLGHKVGVNAAIENEVKKKYGVSFLS